MSTLPKRQLGKDGPLVPRLGLGCMGLSIQQGDTPLSDPERLSFLTAAHARGETFWVTSDRYADSELLLGKWFTSNPQSRDSIFLTTKFGCVPGLSPLDPNSIRTDAPYIHTACTRSLATLGVSKINLYKAHRLDSVTPIETTVKAMLELKAQGKIEYLGFSEISADSLRRACKVGKISAVEVEYSAFSTDVERNELLAVCREEGVGVVAYSPLGRGLLTGRFKGRSDFVVGDARISMMPRFSDENLPRNLQLVQKIEELAKRKGVTSGQLSLAWLLAQGDDIFPIPGTKKIERLEENLGALDVVLSSEEEREIRKVVDEAEVFGDRYPEGSLGFLYKDSPPLES